MIRLHPRQGQTGTKPRPKPRPRPARPEPPRPLQPVPKKRHVPGIIAGPIVLALVGLLIFTGIKWAYGGFGHYYDLSLDMPRASQLLDKGSDVRMHGVVVGKIKDIELRDRTVHLVLQMDKQYKVPASATAYVDLKTLLGAKYIDLRFDHYAPPFLSDGARIRSAHVGPELEDVLADGVAVLNAIRPGDLATVVSTLAHASAGHGVDVAHSLDVNAQLSTIFAGTLDSQLRALHDFKVIFGALEHSGVDLNNLADAINQGVPVYASPQAQKALDRALRALVPFSNNLADLFILNRADWDRLFDSGDQVLTAISSRPEGLRSLVVGLYRYVFKLSGAPVDVGDGSGAAGFVDFIGGNTDAENRAQLCAALPLDIRPNVPICNGSA
jgi:virulence factor Mce-like protein